MCIRDRSHADRGPEGCERQRHRSGARGDVDDDRRQRRVSRAENRHVHRHREGQQGGRGDHYGDERGKERLGDGHREALRPASYAKTGIIAPPPHTSAASSVAWISAEPTRQAEISYAVFCLKKKKKKKK